eukprot:CAMPEP_0198650098 /NCGR_PEP_ID=MMETSP1467-20131203/4729_1 /TAXON_ID=1462469 /ORGANISM="unid. sp., Strain CCMP2135" /LENGTH=707 /DNA_ID=CAMNT_0044385931 /DNA_START=116 /DNA_END=2239 /DNA_ORIENTATION=+
MTMKPKLQLVARRKVAKQPQDRIIGCVKSTFSLALSSWARLGKVSRLYPRWAIGCCTFLLCLFRPFVAFGSHSGGLMSAGPQRDALILLACAALVAPTLKNWGASPILGFLAAGAVLGPDALGVVSQVQTEKALAELGVVIFLFEMGLGLSLERLSAMRREIFGLGVAQYFLSAAVLAIGGGLWMFKEMFQGLAERVVIGGALALSSSAFALQLLRDRDELATNHGRAALGILLLQDLAVVPLLVAIPVLGGTTATSSKPILSASLPYPGVGHAAAAVSSWLALASVKAAVAFGLAEVLGKRLLDNLFYFAAKSQSQEAFLSVVLLTVFGMSALTDSLGLSGALGAFLAGVALSETRYRYQVEADVAPFRGMLLGLFFVTAGFSIDIRLIATSPWLIFCLAASFIGAKIMVLFAIARFFRGLPSSAALRLSFLLAPGGEFAFVALGSASSFNVLPASTCDLLQTTTALTMAATPVLNAIGSVTAPMVDQVELCVMNWVGSGFGIATQRQRDDRVATVRKEADPVVVCGYGRVGRVVCELLDAKFVDYIVFDLDPKKATSARRRGKPVFFGDLGRPEILDYFRIGDAKLVVVAVSDQTSTNRIVVALRRKYSDLDVIARAVDKDHQRRLTNVLGVVALVPAIPENSRLLSLPFAGAVLKALDYDDVDLLIEEARRSALGLYSGQQSATLIDEEQRALLEQLCLLHNDD